MVVVGVESPAQNDASGPEHARVTLTRYLHAHRVVLPKSLASERCDHFLVTHVQFLMPTTTVGIVGIHTMLRARF